MLAEVDTKSKKGNLRSENPDPIDVHVGARMRIRRNLIGLSQEQLGKSLGLTFQQIQKYERGTNRMGSSRLFHIAKTLSVPITFFFEGMPATLELVAGSDSTKSGQKVLPEILGLTSNTDIMNCRETLDLIRAYYHIKNSKQRRKVYELICSMTERE